MKNLKEDSTSKFNTDNSIGNDNLPTYNNVDSKELQDNNIIPDNIDEIVDVINERILTYMPNSKSIDVKKKCRLAGKGNTSDACNQGDINNFKMGNLDESILPSNEMTKEVYSKEEIKRYASNIINAYNKTKNKQYLDWEVIDDLSFYDMIFNGNYKNFSMFKEIVGNDTALELYDFIRETLTNWGLLKNRKIFNEDVDGNVIQKNDKSIETVVNGSRDVGFVSLNNQQLNDIYKYGLKTIKIYQKGFGFNNEMYIIYRDKIKAYKLLMYLKNNGGFLNDKTPQEAYQIGKLLDYNDQSIKSYIDKKYKFVANKTENDYSDLDEDYLKTQKDYVKTGIYDQEDIDIILSITNKDAYTKLIADTYKFLSNKFGNQKPKRLNAYEIDVLKKMHDNLVNYNKNILPIKDLFAQEKYTHPLDINDSLNLRNEIISELREIPSIYLRNLKNDIHVERNYYEFQELLRKVKSIIKDDKLLKQSNPENYDKIIKKIFSSENKTFDDVYNHFNNIDMLYLSHDETIQNILSDLKYSNGDAELLYNDNNILVLAIRSAQAMMHFGCASQWCFARSESWWDDYAGADLAIIVYNFNELNNSRKRMVVVLDNYSVYDMYNDYIEDGIDYLMDLDVLEVIEKEIKSVSTNDEEEDLDENNIPEGVGDKYAEKLGVYGDFHNFYSKYNAKKNELNKEEIIDADGEIFIKNPKSLKNIDNDTKGIIDSDGNLYLQQEYGLIHQFLLKYLKDYVGVDNLWFIRIPKNFICVTRIGNTNKFALSESYVTLLPDELRHSEFFNKYFVNRRDEVLPVYEKYLNKCKEKNPNLDFINEKIDYFLNKNLNENYQEKGDDKYFINGEEVGIDFFVKKYDEWNDGSYKDATKSSVLEFLENNYEDFSTDNRLISRILIELNKRDLLNESRESKYYKTKKSVLLSKSLSDEMKEKILKYLTSGSKYIEGGRLHGLMKPKGFTEKTSKSKGVGLGADKNGFYCYTHRAASKRYDTPESIPVSAIEFIESTG